MENFSTITTSGSRTESSELGANFSPLSRDSNYGLSPGAGFTRDLFRKAAPASTYASDTFAKLTRDQWQSYVQNFVPFENKLIDYATNPSVVSGAMADASSDVNSAFDNRQAATTRRLGSLGLSLNADEQRASTRSFGLARSLADVQGQNSARDVTMARQQQILGSPMPRAGLGLASGPG